MLATNSRSSSLASSTLISIVLAACEPHPRTHSIEIVAPVSAGDMAPLRNAAAAELTVSIAGGDGMPHPGSLRDGNWVFRLEAAELPNMGMAFYEGSSLNLKFVEKNLRGCEVSRSLRSPDSEERPVALASAAATGPSGALVGNITKDQVERYPNPKCTLIFNVEPKEIQAPAPVMGIPSSCKFGERCELDSKMVLLLEPKPPQGYKFFDWGSDSPCHGSISCAVTCDFPLQLTAIFRKKECGAPSSWCNDSAVMGVRGVWGPQTNPGQEYWAVGTEGLLMHKLPGQREQFDSIAAGMTLRGIWGNTKTGELWAVGEERKVFYYRSGMWGEDVNAANKLGMGTGRLFAIHGNEGLNELWIVGENGTVLKRNAAGAWERHDIPVGIDGGITRLFGVWAGPSAVVVGQRGTIGPKGIEAFNPYIAELNGSTWVEIKPQIDGITGWRAVWGSAGSSALSLWVGGTRTPQGGYNVVKLQRSATSWDSMVSPKSVFKCGNDATTVNALWGKSESEVWAAGDYGVVCMLMGSGLQQPEHPEDRILQGHMWSLWGPGVNDIVRSGGDDGLYLRVSAGPLKSSASAYFFPAPPANSPAN